MMDSDNPLSLWEAIRQADTAAVQAMGCLVDRDDGIERITSREFDQPWFNFARVIAPPQNKEAALQRLVHYYHSRGTDARLQVPCEAVPGDFEPMVMAAGFYLREALTILYYDGNPVPPPENPRIRIYPVQPDGVILYTNLVIEGFGGQPDDGPYARQLWIQHRKGLSLGNHLYIAEYDGEPAGTGAVGSSPISQITAISTLPRFRRKGIATAMIYHLMQEAARRGARLFYLAAETEDAARLYRSLGFQDLIHLHNYILPQESQ